MQLLLSSGRPSRKSSRMAIHALRLPPPRNLIVAADAVSRRRFTRPVASALRAGRAEAEGRLQIQVVASGAQLQQQARGGGRLAGPAGKTDHRSCDQSLAPVDVDPGE